MSRMIILIALFSAVLVPQQPVDPDHPFPNHEEPPASWHCYANAPDVEHRCACLNMPKGPDDPICRTNETADDHDCKVWCHKDHCWCKLACDHD